MLRKAVNTPTGYITSLRRAKILTAGILFVAAVTMSVVTASCSHAEDEGAKVNVLRLDSIFTVYPTLDSASRADVIAGHRPELTAFMEVLEADTLSDRMMMAWSQSLPAQIFGPMTDSAFVSLEDFEVRLGKILHRAGKEGLKIPVRRYCAVAWGRSEAVLFNGETVFIALNHYLGPDSPAYGDWPAYRRQNKRPEMMSYDIAEALVGTAYPYTAQEGQGNVLGRMIYEGALTEAKMRLVPDAMPAQAMGFTDRQLKDITDNRQLIWQKMVGEKMLYSTDEDLMDRLFALLPHSTPISPSAPGRTARFIGYEIVRSYLDKNPDTPLSTLLSPDFYNSSETLRASGYTPAAAPR